MSFNLYTSNRLENLADKLAEVVAQPLSSPLAAETIIVQSFGMQQWIAFELARRFGIWTNCRYPFPNTFLQELFAIFVPDAQDSDAFERDVMAWRIMAQLPQCIMIPGFEPLKTYLEEDRGFFRTWQLSRQIANLFDQYCIYRPNMILKWEAGNGSGWQAELWRLLTRGQRASHKAAMQRRFFSALRDAGQEKINKIPQRIAVFGISTLPLFHMQVLAALSEHCQVNLFLMNPSQEYWAEIKSKYEITRMLRREKGLEPSPDYLHLETGNSLLASMGGLGRDFLSIIMDHDPEVAPCFERPAGNTLLHLIQADILDMADRGAVGQEQSPQKQFSDEEMRADNSVSIHSCHSPMREAEVLYDFLLEVFNRDPAIQPRDILVMTPDIEEYAPFIRAVFDAPGNESQRVPYTIADQTVRRHSNPVKTFLSVLELGKNRFGVSGVIDILECPAVQRRFNLLPADMDLVRRWIKETRICWGIDAAYRSKLGLPAIKHNTWLAGVERLLLGYAMPGREERLFSDILPYDHIEGSAALVLGNFISFLEVLFSTAVSPGESLTTGQWQEKLLSLLDSLLLPDDDEAQDLIVLRAAIARLDMIAQQAGFTEKIGLDVVVSWLEHSLQEQYIGRSFLTGKVTFCAMLPMRSIPFKIICMLGMNDGAFPRKTSELGFDLIARYPRRGDRSLRSDDRYLFLEAVISAREKLYISYVGQGIQDNSELPPSVLVSELLDYCEQGYAVPGKRIQDYLVVKHRLQAFSPRYFDQGGALYSYSQENCEASRAMLEERREPPLFIVREMAAPEAQKKTITVSDLIRFYDNPAKYLLNKTIGLYLGGHEDTLEDREPFELAGLDKYQLAQRLCERYIAGQDAAPVYRAAEAAGLLPHGTAGAVALQAITPRLLQLSETVRACIRGDQLPPLSIACECGGYWITGTISNVWPDTLLHYRSAKVKAKDRIRIWIQHLLCSVADAAAPDESILIGTDCVWKTGTLRDIARQELEKLVALYDRGLTSVLHFFPKSSLDYADALNRGKTPEDALRAARATWAGSDYAPGENSDPYYALCFRGHDPLDTEFETLSRELFDPLMKYQKKAPR
jgi:exodeoxyribonuclease V gamma subunit